MKESSGQSRSWGVMCIRLSGRRKRSTSGPAIKTESVPCCKQYSARHRGRCRNCGALSCSSPRLSRNLNTRTGRKMSSGCLLGHAKKHKGGDSMQMLFVVASTSPPIPQPTHLSESILFVFGRGQHIFNAIEVVKMDLPSASPRARQTVSGDRQPTLSVALPFALSSSIATASRHSALTTPPSWP